MLSFLKRICGYIAEKKATTMIDYALVITGVSIVITTLALTMGDDLNAIFEQFVNSFGDASSV